LPALASDLTLLSLVHRGKASFGFSRILLGCHLHFLVQFRVTFTAFRAGEPDACMLRLRRNKKNELWFQLERGNPARAVFW
jgi:hypothetical protein